MSCVIVLGCYRSGTSAVAGILHNLGVHMGDKFDEPNQNNPKGYFEDLELKHLFDQLSSGKEVEGLLKVAVKMREATHELWGVKDPKLCVLLHKFLPLLSTDHKLIVVRRPQSEICDSMARAIGYSDPSQYTTLVEYYLARMEAHVGHYAGPKLEVPFRELKAEHMSWVHRIATFVNRPVTEAALAHVGG